MRGCYGRCLVVFHRSQRPRQDYRLSRASTELAPAIALLVDDLVSFTSSPQSHHKAGLGSATA